MKLSLSNGIFSKRSLEENMATVKALGFENLEFNMKCVEKDDENSVYTAKKLIGDYGLNCLTVHAASLNVKNENEIARAVYYGKVSSNFAYTLSAPIMVVHSNISTRLPESMRSKVLARIFKEITTYAKNLNLKLALENLSRRSICFGKTVLEIEEILRIVDENEIMGITLDFCHAENIGQTLALLEKYKNRLCNVHVSQGRHSPINKVTPNLNAFLTKLQQDGYNGPLTIELNSRCKAEGILKTKAVLEKF